MRQQQHEPVRTLLHEIAERQSRLAYFIICFMFIALCVVLSKFLGLVLAVCAFVLLVCALECLYRAVRSTRIRHSQSWWAKERRSSSRFVIRSSVYLTIAIVTLVVRSSLARWSLFIILVLGFGFALAFRFFRKQGEL